MKKCSDLLFFRPNRVWRCYLGGELLDKFMGRESGGDNLFPENWLGSVTAADNGEHSTSENEGLSQTLQGDFFCDLLQQNSLELLGNQGGNLGVLCKFLDSAIRLPLQCHPDKEFARKYCNSDYGKTESWFILDTREINGEKPYILLGFKENVDKKLFKKAVMTQDIDRLLSMMHKIEVKKGDAFFIPGRIPHAIGSGVFMLEVQEPTDLVVQPERKIGNIQLSDKDMWQNLTPELGLECFNYQGERREKILEKLQIKPRKISENMLSLIDEKLTDCFQVKQLNLGVRDKIVLPLDKWYLGVVTSGKGEVKSFGKNYSIRRSDCFFVPASAEELEFENSGSENLQIFLINL